MSRRRQAFTLIELLVVIAIIGILAAMVFPVFARARESARKAVCLSNVKNIALAIQMYLGDYERFPTRGVSEPSFAAIKGMDDCADKSAMANPHMRWPAILEEYTRNRDVWTCPSARLTMGAMTIVPDYYPGGWIGYWQTWAGAWTSNAQPGMSPCAGAWPPGWGGSITDTFLQDSPAFAVLYNAGGAKNFGGEVFQPGILCNEAMTADKSESAIDDPASWVICGDEHTSIGVYFDVFGLAYSDECAAGCLCGDSDWENCPWSVDCGKTVALSQDPSWQAKHARHLGGTNVGFADGHARWYNSRDLLSKAPRRVDGYGSSALVDRELQGLTLMAGATSAAGAPGVPEGSTPSVADCGIPVLY